MIICKLQLKYQRLKNKEFWLFIFKEIVLKNVSRETFFEMLVKSNISFYCIIIF